jgi:Tfp pilus assembly protein PilZ
MRRYDRQSTYLSIDVKTDFPTIMEGDVCMMTSIGQGGFSCRLPTEIDIGSMVNIEVPSVSPAYEGTGEVVWCEPEGDLFEVGVAFTDNEESLTARMVQQVCQIERYKKLVYDQEGRMLDAGQAASEWIEKYAKPSAP